MEWTSSEVVEAVITTCVSHPVRLSLTTTLPVYSHSVLREGGEERENHAFTAMYGYSHRVHCVVILYTQSKFKANKSTMLRHFFKEK